jgi:hypothetical protein
MDEVLRGPKPLSTKPYGHPGLELFQIYTPLSRAQMIAHDR